jgi:hypothetical protein
MFADVAGTLQGFLDLGRGWDGEAARPVDAAAVALALDLLRSIDRIAMRRQARWRDPQVAPDPDGAGVDLIWQQAEHWLMLSVLPGEAHCVLVTSQRTGEEAHMRRASLAEATDEALALLEPMVVFGARE